MEVTKSKIKTKLQKQPYHAYCTVDVQIIKGISHVYIKIKDSLVVHVVTEKSLDLQQPYFFFVLLRPRKNFLCILCTLDMRRWSGSTNLDTFFSITIEPKQLGP